MKKVLVLSIISIVLLLSVTICHAEGNLKLFYDGNIYPLQESIISLDNENFIDAWDFANIVGMNYSIDSDYKNIKIDFKDSVKSFDIQSYTSYKPSDYISHDSPELINNKLYLPFSFIKNNYQMVIKYNKDNNIAYIFPGDIIDNTTLKTFSNISYNYSFPIPDNVEVTFNEANKTFIDSSISVRDKNGNYTAVISCNRLDSSSLLQMRDYLKNYTSSDEELFDKFAEYKDGYFIAMQEYYKKDFLYGSRDKNASESNMKIFAQYSEKVFSRDSNIVLYNIINSNKLSSNEETHINISIPVKMGNSVFSIYSIDFSVKKGGLDDVTLSKMSNFLNSIKIRNLIKQTHSLYIFRNEASIKSANLGIYPDLTEIKPEYSVFNNSSLGYQITYPSVFIPYRQNNIIDSYDYESFKINYNSFFSIAAEPVVYNNVADICDKVKNIELLNKGNITTVEDSVYKTPEGYEFRFFKYELDGVSSKMYIQDYFITHDSEIYDIQLNSRYVPPSQKIQEEFLKIVFSIKFSDKIYSSFNFGQPLVEFINPEEGYSFYYSDNWKISSKKSKDVNYDIFELKSPFISGAIDISVSEGELAKGLNPDDLLLSSDETGIKELGKYYTYYNSPLSDKINWLLCSNCYKKDNVVYIVKLVNYLDENGRNKYMYIVDAARGSKVYSLFISASDYTAFNGKVLDKNLTSLINLVSSTFSLETTKELLDRQALNETRNRKIVFIENYFKCLFGTDNAFVDSASYLDSSDIIQVKLTGVSMNGYYKLRLDYDNKHIDILDYIKVNEGE